LMGNAEIFISFLANLLISASKHVTLNQRVQGSSPCAPTNKHKYLSSLFDGAQDAVFALFECPHSVHESEWP
jgi:hypothetical protein